HALAVSAGDAALATILLDLTLEHPAEPAKGGRIVRMRELVERKAERLVVREAQHVAEGGVGIDQPSVETDKYGPDGGILHHPAQQIPALVEAEDLGGPAFDSRFHAAIVTAGSLTEGLSAFSNLLEPSPEKRAAP